METTTTIESNGQATKKRTIRPRVLKSDHDILQKKFKFMFWLAIAGWLAFAFALKYAVE
jgi:hypothetical protein